MRSLVTIFALVGALVPASPAFAQAAPFCQPGQSPAFVLAFAAQGARLGDTMGQPLECEHANPENGDALQQTSTGLAFYRKAMNTPTFTNGFEHWGSTPGGLVHWTGESIDPPDAVRAPAPEPVAEPGVSDPVARVEELTNAERQKAGLRPLTLNPNLLLAAQDYAAVMAASSCLRHECGPVPRFSDRATAAGYTGWFALAENVAAGYRVPEEVVAGWMSSPGHRANILNDRVKDLGVGRATGGSMSMYWVQVFGARR